MTISKELFLAILSLDSYNRGYHSAVSDGKNVEDGVDLGLGDSPGLQIGSAKTLARVDSRENGTAQAASFYAIAYEAGAGIDGIAPERVHPMHTKFGRALRYRMAKMVNPRQSRRIGLAAGSSQRF